LGRLIAGAVLAAGDRFAAVQVALSAFGGLNTLANNSGFGHLAPFEQMSQEQLEAVIATNFYISTSTGFEGSNRCLPQGPSTK
jgi:NAD(P)-dependent dehydrogenase (short-subunit alcohol dehydrogenase family)